MIRKLTNKTAEFEPAMPVSVVFSETEIYVFKKVVRAQRLDDGTIFLELEDQGFVELLPNYRFYQVGGTLVSE